jgi:hypothetical protein
MFNTPVLVLGRPLIQRNDIYTSNRFDGKGREGLVGGDGRPGRQSEETLKVTNGTANSSAFEEPRRPSPATLSTSRQLPSGARIYNVAVQATSSETPKPEGGARVEIESLPGQNQIKPTLDDARIDTPMIPGVNEDTSNMGEASRPVMPAAADDAPPPPPGLLPHLA